MTPHSMSSWTPSESPHLTKVVREAADRGLIALFNAEGNPNHGEHGWFSGGDAGGGGPETKVNAHGHPEVTRAAVEAAPGRDPLEKTWNAMTADHPAPENPQEAHPDRYEPNKVFGVHLKDGAVETRIDATPGKRPTVYEVAPVPTREVIDKGLTSEGMNGTTRSLVRVPGSERPLSHVFRLVDEREYQQAVQRGYLQSDERMNLGAEGTVTSTHSTGGFYSPPSGSDARILRIRNDPSVKWATDSDGYVKTHDRIPVGHIDRVSPVIHVVSASTDPNIRTKSYHL